MSRELRVVPAGPGMLDELREALSGGPAILPIPVDAAGTRPPDLPERVAQPVALVVETSGSTGAPKRVALSADALLANAGASESALGGPGQWVLALPTHYIAGLNVLARSIAAGTEPVVVHGARFTPAAFVAATRALELPERYTSLVPAQLSTLLDDPTGVDALRTFLGVLVGGQATPPSLLERARDRGVRVVRSYGTSETSGGCVYDGVPIGQTTARVVDDELWLGGPSLAEGYLGDEELTADRFVTADGARWFRTADTGRWSVGDAAGPRLEVLGRRDDVLISGGVNVSAGAVERVLREQQGFGDAVVVPAPDERWGEVPVAFTASAADPAPAVDAVARELGVAARPARVIRLDALPTLPSGKPDRRALMERARGGGAPAGG